MATTKKKTKKAAAPAPAPAKLTDEQVRLGSMHCAIENLGYGSELVGTTTKDGLRRVFGRVDQDIAEASSTGAEPERKAWERDLRRGPDRDKLAADLRKRAPYIFEPGI